jgi:hypothetical protein
VLPLPLMLLPPWLVPWPDIEPPDCPDPPVCAWAKPIKPTIKPAIRTDEAEFLSIDKTFMTYPSISLQQNCCFHTLLRLLEKYCSLTHRVKKCFSTLLKKPLEQIG